MYPFQEVNRRRCRRWAAADRRLQDDVVYVARRAEEAVVAAALAAVLDVDGVDDGGKALRSRLGADDKTIARLSACLVGPKPGEADGVLPLLTAEHLAEEDASSRPPPRRPSRRRRRRLPGPSLPLLFFLRLLLLLLLYGISQLGERRPAHRGDGPLHSVGGGAAVVRLPLLQQRRMSGPAACSSAVVVALVASGSRGPRCFYSCSTLGGQRLSSQPMASFRRRSVESGTTERTHS